MTYEDLFKIGLIIVGAVGLLAVTQIYKPQIIEKTCEVVNNNILTDSVIEPAQVEHVYSYFTVYPILTTAFALIISIVYNAVGSGIVIDINSTFDAFLANRANDLNHELTVLNSAHVVTTLLNDQTFITKLNIINDSKFIFTEDMYLSAIKDFFSNAYITNLFRNNLSIELINLDNLSCVTEFLDDPNRVLEIKSIILLKDLAKSFPIPVSEFNLSTLLAIDDFSARLRYIYYKDVGGDYGAASAAFIKILLKSDIFNEITIKEFIEAQEESGWGKLVALYLYSYISVCRDNPEIVKQIIDVDTIKLVQQYSNIFNKLGVSDIIYSPGQSIALIDVIGYLARGVEFPELIKQNIDIGSGHLGLRYLTWGDLLYQKFVLGELENVSHFYGIDKTVYNNETVVDALVGLKTSDNYNAYLFCKNVIKIILSKTVT